MTATYKTKVLFVDLENGSFGDGDLRVGGAGGPNLTYGMQAISAAVKT